MILPDFNNIQILVTFTGVILSIGMIISTLELIFYPKQLNNNGLYSWMIWREMKFRKNVFLKNNSALAFEATGVTIAMVIRLVLLLYFIYTLLIGEGLVLWVVLLVYATQLYYSFRLPVGKDGSDQMSNIVLTCLVFISLFPQSKIIVSASILFIAYQAIISYITAGVSKLISPTWRNGNIVYGIVNTKTYGSKFIANFLKDRPKVVKFMNHSTFIFEVLFFVVLFIPYPYNIYVLLIPFIFHLLCAWIMGLNSFVFAFLATYPSVIFISNAFQKITSQFLINLQL